MATRMLKVKLEENNLGLEEELDQGQNQEELCDENDDYQDQVGVQGVSHQLGLGV
jgi:hypothetical protein